MVNNGHVQAKTGVKMSKIESLYVTMGIFEVKMAKSRKKEAFATLKW